MLLFATHLCVRIARRAGRFGWMFAVATLVPAHVAFAQYDARHVELLSQVPLESFPSNPANGNDCWGYVSPSGREYALMGLDNAMAVVEITDPRHPAIVGSVPHVSQLQGDVKVYDHYCYVTNEGAATQIVDLGDVDNGNISMVGEINTAPHNIAIDAHSGFFYSAYPSSFTYIFDLADPVHPIGVGSIRTSVHDLQVHTFEDEPNSGRQIAFCAAGYGGLAIYDVTTKNPSTRLSALSYGGVYCHQGWLTEDSRYFLIDDELDEQGGRVNTTTTYVVDVSDLKNPFLAATFTSGSTSTDHNLYIKGHVCYEANYKSGLRIFDISDPLHAQQIGWFDTYPESDTPGYNGAWSNYPYFPSGNIIVSDMARGLFVLDASAATDRLRFNVANGVPDHLDPRGERVRVEVVNDGSDPQPGTGMLHYTTGQGWNTVAMEVIADNVYDAVFPVFDCGEIVNFYFSAMSVNGHEYTDPILAPEMTHSAVSTADLRTVFADDFEQDLGWVATTPYTPIHGAWVRTVPIPDNLGGPGLDYDGSGQCYLTSDEHLEHLSGAPVVLRSPLVDLSNADRAYLQFAHWMRCTDRDDFLTLDASSDGGQNWVRVDAYGHDPQWKLQLIDIGNVIPLTSQVQFRFTVSDPQRSSYTNAAIDAVQIFAGGCSQLRSSHERLTFAINNANASNDSVSLAWSNAKAHHRLAVFASPSIGSLVIPSNGPCAGAALGLDGKRSILAGTFDSGDGSGQVRAPWPNTAHGICIQLLESGDCATSNVVRLP